MNDHIIRSGHLDVGDGHNIYFEEWGNKEATPIISLHGGPGDLFDEGSRKYYDPQKHHVIFHDQRGCGRSTPFASTEHNTSPDLVEDIEKLRRHLNLKKVAVIGGSWGSTLTLLYAIAHPEAVSHMLIWGVFLMRQEELDYVNEGYAKSLFPEAWERFMSHVPKDQQKNGDSIMKFYADRIRSKDQDEARRYADEWTLWEYTLCSLEYDPIALEKEVTESKWGLSTALLETHYFMNKCFVPTNHILNNVEKIKHIPLEIVQGRFDFCTPPYSARDLSLTYGKNAHLTWVNSGHYSGADPKLLDTIKIRLNALLQ